MIENHEALIKEGKWDEAEAALVKFVADHPVHPKGHALLGMCIGRKGDVAGAAEHFQRAYALDPTDWGSGKNLLKCYEYLGKHKEGNVIAHALKRNRPSDTDLTEAIERFATIQKELDKDDDRGKVWGR